MEATDEALVEATQKSDREAYGKLTERHARGVFALCYGILGNPNDAEDVAQESFIQGFERIGSLRDGTRFAPWIRTIARNRCADLCRSSKCTSELSPHLEDAAQNFSPDHWDLRQAIEQLPEILRTPLLLYYFEGCSTEEIAASLDLAPASVHTRLSRARKKLHQLLADKKEIVK